MAKLLTETSARWLRDAMQTPHTGATRLHRPPRDLADAARLVVGPTTEPGLTQVHEGAMRAALADCLRVVNLGSSEDPDYRLCIDIDRAVIGSVTDEVYRPLSDFFGIAGASEEQAVGLKLTHVVSVDYAETGTVVAELPVEQFGGTGGDSKIYPKGAYPL